MEKNTVKSEFELLWAQRYWSRDDMEVAEDDKEMFLAAGQKVLDELQEKAPWFFME